MIKSVNDIFHTRCESERFRIVEKKYFKVDCTKFMCEMRYSRRFSVAASALQEIFIQNETKLTKKVIKANSVSKRQCLETLKWKLWFVCGKHWRVGVVSVFRIQGIIDMISPRAPISIWQGWNNWKSFPIRYWKKLQLKVSQGGARGARINIFQ